MSEKKDLLSLIIPMLSQYNGDGDLLKWSLLDGPGTFNVGYKPGTENKWMGIITFFVKEDNEWVPRQGYKHRSEEIVSEYGASVLVFLEDRTIRIELDPNSGLTKDLLVYERADTVLTSVPPKEGDCLSCKDGKWILTDSIARLVKKEISPGDVTYSNVNSYSELPEVPDDVHYATAFDMSTYKLSLQSKWFIYSNGAWSKESIEFINYNIHIEWNNAIDACISALLVKDDTVSVEACLAALKQTT